MVCLGRVRLPSIPSPSGTPPGFATMSVQEMASIQNLEIAVVLLVAVLVLTTLARNLLLPYPILLVVGGLALSALPKMPVIRLDPDMVFLIFLPPILWSAAYFTSLRDFRA